jgi:hypothetical protein
MFLRISYTTSIIINSFVTVKIKNILISIITNIIGNIFSTISLRKIGISLLAQETGNIFSTVNNFLPINISYSERQTAISNIGDGFIHFSLTPIIAVFSILNTFDPQTLGTLDTSTLGTMDQS